MPHLLARGFSIIELTLDIRNLHNTNVVPSNHRVKNDTFEPKGQRREINLRLDLNLGLELVHSTIAEM
jgi:hypothetical protein